MGNPSQSYGASLDIWDHTVLPACHPTHVNAPRLNPSQTGRYSIYLPRRDRRLS